MKLNVSAATVQNFTSFPLKNQVLESLLFNVIFLNLP